MLIGRSRLFVKSLRDFICGLGAYTVIALLALEDGAQAGNGLVAIPHTGQDAWYHWSGDPVFMTLIGLGLLFAVLSAFTMAVLRHFGQTYALVPRRPGTTTHLSRH